MKKVELFYLPQCPHCKLAFSLIKELQQEDSKYGSVVIEMIDESREKAYAEKHDYWYVPCFYIDNVKVSEGHVEKPDVKKVLDQAIGN